MLRCGIIDRSDECARRTGCRKAGFAHGNVPPARDSLQLHVVLRPRDRDPPARRADAGTLLDELRGERRTGRSARMLYEVLGDIWVVAAQSLPAGRPARQPASAARCWSRRCTTAWARSRSAARPTADAGARRAWSASCSQRPRTRGRRASRRSFATTGDLRKRTARALRARTRAKDNIKFDGLARVSHVTDATDWRVEYPFVVLHAGHRGRDAPASSRAASSSA